MSSLSDKVDWYVDKLVLQYRTKARARGLVEIVLKQIMADAVGDSIGAAFDLELAVGPQLDVIGRYAGVSRFVGVGGVPPLFSLWTYGSALDPTKYQGTWDPATDSPTIPAAAGGNAGFWYVASASGHSTSPIAEDFVCGDIIVSDGAAWSKDATDCGNGLTTYADPAVNANATFWSYSAASRSVSALTDASYRALIKLKIILNANDGTLASIQAALNAFFPGLIFLVDNADFSLSYSVVSTVPLSVDVLKAFLPRPMGVGISVTIINPVPAGGGDLTTEGGDVLTTEGGDPLKSEP